jgi:thiol-disulfide isomerase/thioredoxin
VLAAVLPDLELEEVATGTGVAVRSLVDGDRPLLVWFWAPHCPRCNREIPDLDAFAAATPGLQVIGLGTQDSAGEARDFMERHEVEAVELLWDDGYASWQHFGVQVQPFGILYSPAGVELERWPGEVDLDELDAALG